MKKLIYTLLAVSLIFSACEKEEKCKTCGTWYTIDDDLTAAEELVIQAGIDQLMQMAENGNQELCGEQLEALEQTYSSLGSSATTQMPGYTATQECR